MYVKEAHRGQTKSYLGSKMEEKSNLIWSMKALVSGKVESGDLKNKFWN